mmetsp:Transcript_6982/g.11235  ORF Transcript_6982/g.11235 Transcript_6982/m.11235 type:complete len:212 (-) Transcript_6982:2169-2804(-)
MHWPHRTCIRNSAGRLDPTFAPLSLTPTNRCGRMWASAPQRSIALRLVGWWQANCATGSKATSPTATACQTRCWSVCGPTGCSTRAGAIRPSKTSTFPNSGSRAKTPMPASALVISSKCSGASQASFCGNLPPAASPSGSRQTMPCSATLTNALAFRTMTWRPGMSLPITTLAKGISGKWTWAAIWRATTARHLPLKNSSPMAGGSAAFSL